MPYVIVSTVALLSNLYKNAPLIVGDKDSDPELMRFLGARITTNYPACGSPAMYVMHAPPRTVFDNLEKRGYCLMSAQTIQEHSVWILARPRVPDDDKVEISRGGPNDKSIQAFEDNSTQEEDAPAQAPTPKKTFNRARSPSTKTPRLKVPDTDNAALMKLGKNNSETVNVTSKGDGNADLLSSEKIHMRIQVSDSDVSITKNPENLANIVIFDAKRPTTISKHSIPSMEETEENTAPVEARKDVRAISGKNEFLKEFEVAPLPVATTSAEVRSKENIEQPTPIAIVSPHSTNLSNHFIPSVKEVELEPKPVQVHRKEDIKQQTAEVLASTQPTYLSNHSIPSVKKVETEPNPVQVGRKEDIKLPNPVVLMSTQPINLSNHSITSLREVEVEPNQVEIHRQENIKMPNPVLLVSTQPTNLSNHYFSSVKEVEIKPNPVHGKENIKHPTPTVFVSTQPTHLSNQFIPSAKEVEVEPNQVQIHRKENIKMPTPVVIGSTQPANYSISSVKEVEIKPHPVHRKEYIKHPTPVVLVSTQPTHLSNPSISPVNEVEVEPNQVQIHRKKNIKMPTPIVIGSKQPSNLSNFSISSVKEVEIKPKVVQVHRKENIKQPSPVLLVSTPPFITLSNNSIPSVKEVEVAQRPVQVHQNTQSLIPGRVTRETQANLSSHTLLYSNGWDTNLKNESGITLHYIPENAKKKFDVQKPLMLDSFTQLKAEELVSTGKTNSSLWITPRPIVSGPELITPIHLENQIYSEKQKKEQTCYMKKSVLIRSTCGRRPSIAMLENPIFALTDPNHLVCLTHESGCCCCEEE